MQINEITKENLSSMLPPLRDDIHKGNRGGVFICGGSMNYRGAPLLCALGALRAGAGYVVLAVPDFMAQCAASFLPEAIVAAVKTVNGTMLSAALTRVAAEWENRCAAAVFGPGLGRNMALSKTVAKFIAAWQKPLLLDADALWFTANLAVSARKNILVTPHAGEAATLLSTTADSVQTDRQSAVLRLASMYGNALLKGKNTLVSNGNKIRKIMAGSAALAIPGSGDVLSGIAAAFAASGMEMFDAATAAALAHALSGERLEEKYGLRGALAREIAENLPYVLK